MSTTLTHQPTLLQKLLGANYKWLYATKYEWLSSGATGLADLISQIQIFISNSLWIYISSLSSLESVIYLISGRVFSNLTNNFWYNRIGGNIISGKIVNVLLLPTNTFKVYFFQSLGARIYRNILSTMTIILVLLVFNFTLVKIPLNFNFLLLIPFVPLVFTINFFVAVIIGSTAFFMKDKRDFGTLNDAITSILNILSGLFIPLNTIPFIGKYLIYIPFSLTFYHPTQIYLGKYDTIQTIWVFVGGIAWCVVLYFLAKLVFKLGLKRNESVGL